jgi:hypothetical protein
MKRLCLILFILFSNTFVFATDFDFIIQGYLPTVPGFSVGNYNQEIYKLEDGQFDWFKNFCGEVRIDILTKGRWTLSAGFLCGGFVSSQVDSMNFSLGVGLYHKNKPEAFNLTGTCLYFYPMYLLPIMFNYQPLYYKWKSAWDIGYNFCFEYLSLYLFQRNIFLFSAKEFKVVPEIGLAIGMYFPKHSF